MKWHCFHWFHSPRSALFTFETECSSHNAISKNICSIPMSSQPKTLHVLTPNSNNLYIPIELLDTGHKRMSSIPRTSTGVSIWSQRHLLQRLSVVRIVRLPRIHLSPMKRWAHSRLRTCVLPKSLHLMTYLKHILSGWLFCLRFKLMIVTGHLWCE